MNDAPREKNGRGLWHPLFHRQRADSFNTAKRFDREGVPANSPTHFFSNHMGKQYNKVEKRRRRLSYLKRKKAAAKAALAVKPVKKKAPAKKKEAAPAPAPALAAAEAPAAE